MNDSDNNFADKVAKELLSLNEEDKKILSNWAWAMQFAQLVAGAPQSSSLFSVMPLFKQLSGMEVCAITTPSGYIQRMGALDSDLNNYSPEVLQTNILGVQFIVDLSGFVYLLKRADLRVSTNTVWSANPDEVVFDKSLVSKSIATAFEELKEFRLKQWKGEKCYVP